MPNMRIWNYCILLRQILSALNKISRNTRTLFRFLIVVFQYERISFGSITATLQSYKLVVLSPLILLSRYCFVCVA